MSLSSKECAWSHCKVKMLGRTVEGIRGWSYKKRVAKEALRASGSDPIDIQTGNKDYEGELKMLGFEVDMFDEAARKANYEDITEVPHEAIVISISYKKRPADPMRSVTIMGVAITETGVGMEQGAMHMEQTLPFLAMKIIKA